MPVANTLPPRIRTRADLDACLTVLRDIDPTMISVIDGLGEIPLRLRPAGFGGLAEIIIGQMVSKASAAAIFGRLQDRLGEVCGETVLNAGETALLELGLSRAKMTTLVGLAKAELDFDGLCSMPADEARNQLVALKGIGPWTADVFLMFCAGHIDIFPAGDIALQQAQSDLGLVSERPTAKLAIDIAQKWKPVRAAASRVLWAVYADHRGRGDLPV